MPTPIRQGGRRRCKTIDRDAEAAGCGLEDVIHSGSGLLCYIPLGQE